MMPPRLEEHEANMMEEAKAGEGSGDYEMMIWLIVADKMDFNHEGIDDVWKDGRSCGQKKEQ